MHLKDSLYKLLGTRWCILQLAIGMYILGMALRNWKICLACSQVMKNKWISQCCSKLKSVVTEPLLGLLHMV